MLPVAGVFPHVLLSLVKHFAGLPRTRDRIPTMPTVGVQQREHVSFFHSAFDLSVTLASYACSTFAQRTNSHGLTCRSVRRHVDFGGMPSCILRLLPVAGVGPACAVFVHTPVQVCRAPAIADQQPRRQWAYSNASMRIFAT